MTRRKYKVGDRVKWHSHGGVAEGRVARVATSDGQIEDFKYKASEDAPKYIVETDEGKRAAHTEDALEKA